MATATAPLRLLCLASATAPPSVSPARHARFTRRTRARQESAYPEEFSSMKHSCRWLLACWALMGAVGCGAGPDSSNVRAPSTKTRLDLADLESNPDGYAWFDFRPNVMKLILSGAAETEHVAILWYTVTDGSVGMHYHAKTESVFV